MTPVVVVVAENFAAGRLITLGCCCFFWLSNVNVRSSGVTSPKICLGRRFSKHKMTKYAKNFGGHGPLGPAWLRL